MLCLGHCNFGTISVIVYHTVSLCIILVYHIPILPTKHKKGTRYLGGSKQLMHKRNLATIDFFFCSLFSNVIRYCKILAVQSKCTFPNHLAPLIDINIRVGMVTMLCSFF